MGIAHAIRPFVAEATELFGPLTSADDELVQAETLAALLSDALEPALDHDLLLIFDDAQELASSPASLRLVEGLCQTGPAGAARRARSPASRSTSVSTGSARRGNCSSSTRPISPSRRRRSRR